MMRYHVSTILPARCITYSSVCCCKVFCWCDASKKCCIIGCVAQSDTFNVALLTYSLTFSESRKSNMANTKYHAQQSDFVVKLWTVVHTVLTATIYSYGKGRFRPSPSRIVTHWPINKQFGKVDYVVSNLLKIALAGASGGIRKMYDDFMIFLQFFSMTFTDQTDELNLFAYAYSGARTCMPFGITK